MKILLNAIKNNKTKIRIFERIYYCLDNTK